MELEYEVMQELSYGANLSYVTRSVMVETVSEMSRDYFQAGLLKQIRATDRMICVTDRLELICSLPKSHTVISIVDKRHQESGHMTSRRIFSRTL
jgi:hypothetical protein